jgi:hypothetical protein
MGPVLRTSLFSRLEHELSHVASSGKLGSSGNSRSAQAQAQAGAQQKGQSAPVVGPAPQQQQQMQGQKIAGGQVASQLSPADVITVATALGRIAQGKAEGPAQSSQPDDGDQESSSTSQPNGSTSIPPKLRTVLCTAVLRCLPHLTSTQLLAGVHALAVLGAKVDGKPAERLLKHVARQLEVSY